MKKKSKRFMTIMRALGQEAKRQQEKGEDMASTANSSSYQDLVDAYTLQTNTSATSNTGTVQYTPGTATQLTAQQYQLYLQQAQQSALGALGQSLWGQQGNGVSGTPVQQWNTPPIYPTPRIADMSQDEFEKVIETVFKRMMREFVDKLSTDGITIPIEELKRELEKE